MLKPHRMDDWNPRTKFYEPYGVEDPDGDWYFRIDVDKCISELETWQADVKDYSEYGVKACRLCVYENGVFKKYCVLHKRITEQAKTISEMEASLDMLHGQKFSDRCYHALKSRAETAEKRIAELEAAMKKANERSDEVISCLQSEIVKYREGLRAAKISTVAEGTFGSLKWVIKHNAAIDMLLEETT